MIWSIRWLPAHDAELSATRRAARMAILIPALFTLARYGFELSVFATFTAFGSFATMMFVDYSGTIAQRIQAPVARAITGCSLACLGTLCSGRTYLAVAGMALVGFVVLWPLPARNPLRRQAAKTCRLLSMRLSAEVAYLRRPVDGPTEGRDAARAVVKQRAASVPRSVY